MATLKRLSCCRSQWSLRSKSHKMYFKIRLKIERHNGTERFYSRFSKDFERKRPKYARISGIGNETGRFYLGFQESEVTLPQGEVGFQESGQETGAAGRDCRNLHFHRPCRSPFFWNPAPLMQNYMIKSVKMTKKSILRDQFSWKVRTFAQNLCEDGLHLGKERALCTRFAPSLSHAFRKGCRSFCCSISDSNCDLERDLMNKINTTLKLRSIAQTSTIVVLGLSQA